AALYVWFVRSGFSLCRLFVTVCLIFAVSPANGGLIPQSAFAKHSINTSITSKNSL
ncbi:MAG: hypothetical protein ACI81A_003004, partial [Paraglaciecola sp.]